MIPQQRQPLRYQPPPLPVLRRVARLLREQHTRQDRFRADFSDLPVFRRAVRGHVASVYADWAPPALDLPGSAGKWEEQSLCIIDMQVTAARAEARMNLSVIYAAAMAALQPPRPPGAAQSPSRRHPIGGRGAGSVPPRTGQTLRGGTPPNPAGRVPEKIFRN